MDKKLVTRAQWLVKTWSRSLKCFPNCTNTSNKQILITDLSVHSSIVPQKEKNKIHKELGRDNESNGAMSHSYPKVEYTGTRLWGCKYFVVIVLTRSHVLFIVGASENATRDQFQLTAGQVFFYKEKESDNSQNHWEFIRETTNHLHAFGYFIKNQDQITSDFDLIS